MKYCLMGWLLLGCAFSARAEQGPLVRVGQSFRYFKTARGTAFPHWQWQETDFNDQAWRLAPSGLVLPEDQSPAQIAARPKQTESVFARTRFSLTNVAEIRSLVLAVEHEQGFVATLNGVEIARKVGPGIEYLRDGEDLDHLVKPEVVDISAQRTLLRVGENVLTLEGTRTEQSDSELALAGLLTANFLRGPFVGNATTNSIQIVWRTASMGNSSVEYGVTPALGSVTNLDTPGTNHVVTLTDLQPNTQYFYRVSSDEETNVLVSDVEWFRTLKMTGPIHFVFVGDTGQSTLAQARIAETMRLAQPDLVVHGGDIVYGGFTDATADLRFFNYYRDQLRNTPFYLTIGNHDLNCCGGVPDNSTNGWIQRATNFQQTFPLPTNALTGTTHFYSFDHGDVHFVSYYCPWYVAYVPTTEDVQYQWLTNDLARSQKPWKFLFMHMPVENSGNHAQRDFNSNGILDRVELMSLLLPVAQQYGVQMIFSGHEHNFERFAPTNGLHSVVSGGGGAALYAFTTGHVASAQFWSVNHCLDVRVAGDTISIQALLTNGVLLDGLTVCRTLPARTIYESTWNTLSFPSTDATNVDGNIPGQTFDFVGPPILARAGQFSNLGRVWINNDATNLYVGVDQAMYYANNNLFLFVDSPRLTGVATMAGLGNGLIDPEGQGVDGLDCLENLSFTNFAPAIGCLFGDEYADGQFRSFARSNLDLNIGQGVYRLDAGFSDVPGCRLQQFNRSPQIGTVAYEQNADLIELAIPLEQLGGLKPGDTIKLGLVVGGLEFDPVAQTRQIDTAALGYALHGSGQGPVRLEGVSVRLASGPQIAIAALDQSSYRLRWDSRIGVRYDIDFAPSLTNFSRLDRPDLPLTALTTNVSYDVTPTAPRGFFRIRLLP